MTESPKSSKRASLEDSQSPISHSICGILGLGNSEPGREALCQTETELDAPQVADQDQSAETSEESAEAIQKQGWYQGIFLEGFM